MTDSRLDLPGLIRISEMPALTADQKAEIVAIAGDFKSMRREYEYLLAAARESAVRVARRADAKARIDAGETPAEPHYKDVPRMIPVDE